MAGFLLVDLQVRISSSKVGPICSRTNYGEGDRDGRGQGDTDSRDAGRTIKTQRVRQRDDSQNENKVTIGRGRREIQL